MRSRLRKMMLAFMAAMSVAAVASAAPYYYITELGGFDSDNYSAPSGLNNNGDVVGRARDVVPNKYYAFLYTGGNIYNLGAFDSTTASRAESINDSGQIAGQSYSLDGTRAFRYEDWEVDGGGNLVNGVMNNLGVLTYESVEGTSSVGYGINEDGDVVGFSTVSGRGRGFLYTDSGGMEDIGMFPGSTASTSANAINNNGQITGQCPNGAEVHAFLKNPGEDMVSLGTLGGTSGYGQAINDSGVVAGYSKDTNGDEHAFIYTDAGGMQDLGTLGTGDDSQAYGINNQGDVVGTTDTNTYKDNRAFLFTDDTMYNLNDRVDPSLGWTLYQAADINENGQICGYGAIGGATHMGFLMTPALPGDATLDGAVNITDLGTLIDNYGTTSGATWMMGDFDDDGAVNLADLGALIDNYGATGLLDTQGRQMLAAAGITVPEPSSLALLAAGLVGVLAYFWKKRT